MRNLLTEEERETMKELGKAEGRAEGRAESVTNLMRSMNLSAEDAMDLLMLSEADRNDVMDQIRIKSGELKTRSERPCQFCLLMNEMISAAVSFCC